MNKGMEYEILMLQLDSLTRKFFYAEETANTQQQLVESTIQRLENKTLDLEKLQKESFSTTLLKWFGTFDRVFDKEANEIIIAKLEFDKAYSLKIAAQRRLMELEVEIKEKKIRLRNVKEDLLRRNPNLNAAVSEKERKIAKIQYEYMQTVEAETAGYQLLESISDILVSLDSSETIIKWDSITEIDFLLTFVNHSQLDVAEALILDLERNVQTLERELNDLSSVYENHHLVLSSVRPAIDEFFAVIFSDLSTKQVVEKNIQQLKVLEDHVLEIMEFLTGQKRELENFYSKIKDSID